MPAHARHEEGDSHSYPTKEDIEKAKANDPLRRYVQSIEPVRSWAKRSFKVIEDGSMQK